MSSFLLPSPNFNKNKDEVKTKQHYLPPCGMNLLPRERQPREASVTVKYLHKNDQEIATQKIETQFCEACDMELKSLKDLRLHLAQHEACPVEGCTFLGHPNVMDAHVETLHAAGLFNLVKKLSTPEEIAAWREERRKRYPTLENVLMRQRAQEQRLKRGERIEASQERFGHVEDRKRARLQRNKEGKGNNLKRKANTLKSDTAGNSKVKANRKKPAEKSNKPKAVESTPIPVKQNLTEEDSCAGVSMFRGTSTLKDYKHAKTIKEKNVLTSLLGMYGSDSEASEESEEDDKIQNFAVPTIINVVNDKPEKHSQHFEIKDHTENAILSAINIETSQVTLNECPDEESKANPNSHAVEIKDHTENAILSATNIGTTEIALNECSGEEPEEAPIERVPYVPKLTSNCPTAQPVAAKILEEKNNTVEKPNPVSTRLTQRFRRRSGLDYTKARLRKQNTMLEKLLQADIRHERNVLLQCVRFVCENNFFDIGSKNKAS